MLKKLSSTYKD